VLLVVHRPALAAAADRVVHVPAGRIAVEAEVAVAR
jgi:hypothetical protein